MDLHINTSSNTDIIVSLRKGKETLIASSLPAPHRQAEKLLPLVEQVLKKKRFALTDIKKIIVADEGEGFTALRLGVTTANAVGYALGIPVVSSTGKSLTKRGIRVVSPRYNKPPTIHRKK